MAGHLIRRLHQQSTQVFQARAKSAGLDLTQVQYAAMDALDVHDGIDQARLAALIAYDRATIGGVVERLEKKGFLARSISQRDRRARTLSLTGEGRAMLLRARPLVRALQDDILGPLNGEERAQILALMARALGPDQSD